MIYFFVAIVSFITVYLLIPNIRYIALRFSVIDRKNGRKIHKKVVTKLGGVGIFLGCLGGIVVASIFEPEFFLAYYSQILGLAMCATLVTLLGIYDDFQGSDALTKLTVQIIVAILMTKIGFKLERISVLNLIDINLGNLSMPVTILWLVGITNAINLIDGLDGLAIGITAIASFFFCIYGLIVRENLIIFISLALLGTSIAFLRYNFYPAKIFMGDTGSLFLGFTIGTMAIYKPANLVNSSNIFFIPSVIMLLLPVMDANLAIIRRIIRKQHIFRSDFSHIHHYYIKMGFSQPQAVIRFYIMTFCLGLASLLFF